MHDKKRREIGGNNGNEYLWILRAHTANIKKYILFVLPDSSILSSLMLRLRYRKHKFITSFI